MRKLHQSEILKPPAFAGECIEYTAINGMVFHVLAVANDEYGSCPGCIFYQFKNDRSVAGDGRYICDCGPYGDYSLCYRSYCKFVDMDTIMENL